MKDSNLLERWLAFNIIAWTTFGIIAFYLGGLRGIVTGVFTRGTVVEWLLSWLIGGMLIGIGQAYALKEGKHFGRKWIIVTVGAWLTTFAVGVVIALVVGVLLPPIGAIGILMGLFQSQLIKKRGISPLIWIVSVTVGWYLFRVVDGRSFYPFFDIKYPLLNTIFVFALGSALLSLVTGSVLWWYEAKSHSAEKKP